tara:strand:- start:2176 stop:2379 length:204 start_codon:yes stop_codon:yes gene_type:complete
MKLEIVKETKWNGDIWYSIKLDGVYVAGSSNEKELLKVYDDAKSSPKTFFETKKEVLKSEEIDLSLK